MEDGLHDYGITARSGGSGAKYLSRGYPFAGQPTVDGGDDVHQPFSVEGDDSTLGVFLAGRWCCSEILPRCRKMPKWPAPRVTPSSRLQERLPRLTRFALEFPFEYLGHIVSAGSRRWTIHCSKRGALNVGAGHPLGLLL